MDLWTFQIPLPVALAIVATIGYIFGRRSKAPSDDSAFRSRRELRGQLVAAELEKIAWDLRKNLAKHHSSVSKFRDRVGKLNDERQEATWKELCREAEDILKPTLHLATQIANAYDEIRQQSANLMTFTEVRTDPLTGVNNRRGMADAVANIRHDAPLRDDVLAGDLRHRSLQAGQRREGAPPRRPDAAGVGPAVRRIRPRDRLVARYGGEEFVVVMPQTDLAGGACLPNACGRRWPASCGSPSAAAWPRRPKATRRTPCWPARTAPCTRRNRRAGTRFSTTTGGWPRWWPRKWRPWKRRRRGPAVGGMQCATGFASACL